jgi:hypothetical protein
LFWLVTANKKETVGCGISGRDDSYGHLLSFLLTWQAPFSGNLSLVIALPKKLITE